MLAAWVCVSNPTATRDPLPRLMTWCAVEVSATALGCLRIDERSRIESSLIAFSAIAAARRLLSSLSTLWRAASMLRRVSCSILHCASLRFFSRLARRSSTAGSKAPGVVMRLPATLPRDAEHRKLIGRGCPHAAAAPVAPATSSSTNHCTLAKRRRSASSRALRTLRLFTRSHCARVREHKGPESDHHEMSRGKATCAVRLVKVRKGADTKDEGKL